MPISELTMAPRPVLTIVFHAVVAAITFVIVCCVIAIIANTTVTPSPPTGWSSLDYETLKPSRKALSDYLTTNNIDDKTPMVDFRVATANFGGIFTENIRLLSPWIGTASPAAAILQVEAGARAFVIDIWPDPADRTKPITCCMVDTTEWTVQNWWRNNGLDKGVGRYSNWQHITRNRIPAGDVINAATNAAFNSPNSKQNGDPFFLILKLHGAMTTDYLNSLGDTVKAAIGEHSMSPEWNRTLNQKSLCTAPVSEFMTKCFVIVIPDIQPGYNILPSTNTYASFIQQFLKTNMGEVTNALEQQPNTILFDPGSISTITAVTQPNCTAGGPLVSLPQNGFTVIQPTTGGQSTDNSDLFNGTSMTTLLQTGAQFIAVNYFSADNSDGVLATHFDPANFGVYSFKKGT